jgi:disulfide bond formation protein DsbB
MSLAALEGVSSRALAGTLALASAGALAGAFTVQALGFRPCELCYLQRIAFYACAPAGLVAAFAPPSARRAILWLMALAFAANAALGLYHSGVEWKLWPGPSACTGAALPMARDMNDFMKQIQTTQVVRCDEAALRILGLSMAGWNAILSSGLAALAAAAARRAGIGR